MSSEDRPAGDEPAQRPSPVAEQGAQQPDGGQGPAASDALLQEDLACPICFDTLTDPFVTACGHTFCYICVRQHLVGAKNCPSCSNFLTPDLIHPNFILSKIVKRIKRRTMGPLPSALERLQQSLSDHKAALAEADVDTLLSQLWELKQRVRQRHQEGSMELLLHFLQTSRDDKVQRLAQLHQELQCLDGDIQRVEAAGAPTTAAAPSSSSQQGRCTLPARSGSRPGIAVQAGDGGAAPLPPSLPPQGAGAGAEEPRQQQPQQQAALPPPQLQALARPGSQQLLRASVSIQTAAMPIDAAAAAGFDLGVNPGVGSQPSYPLAPSQQPVTPASAAAAVGQAARHHQHLFQQQQAAQALVQAQAGGQLPSQVAAFAGAAFASLTAHAMVAGGPGGPLGALLPHALLPGMPAGTAFQQQQYQQSPAVFATLLSPSSSAGGGSSGGRPGGGGQRDVLSLLRNKKRRIASQFDDLQQCYLQLRSSQLKQADAAGAAATGAEAGGAIWATAAAGATGAGPVAPGAEAAGAGAATAAAAAAAAAGAAEGAPGLAGAGAGSGTGAGSGAGAAVGPVIDEGLHEFSRLLSVITRCNKLKLVAEIPRPSARQSSSIVSSLEFDRDGTLFATAGVSKRISIYDYACLVPSTATAATSLSAGTAGSHNGGAAATSGTTPVVELVSRSKLSCLSWNKYIQAHIASSDYEGVVAVWDVASHALLHEYEAHSKRIWSVDFCEADPTLLASGSDDCAVKFWSTKAPASVAQVDTKANVCTVRWRPGSAHELAVGSADHSVHLYDMRHTAVPLRTFQGHRRAVSYVRFCNSRELVSASTDSTLRLWSLDPPVAPTAGLNGDACGCVGAAVRVYEGHSNEKNFVGLAVDGNFLACGSETSELYVYYKALSKPVAQQAFAVQGEDAEAQSDKAFISAVCWRPGAQTLLAANSMGAVKVFALTGSSQM